MAMIIDPAKREIRALRRAIRWRGKRILEVGCGDGRLTRRLLDLGVATIRALEPDAKLIRKARRALASERERVRFRIGSAERLPYRAREFDCVVFAWAL